MVAKYKLQCIRVFDGWEIYKGELHAGDIMESEKELVFDATSKVLLNKTDLKFILDCIKSREDYIPAS